MTDYHLSPFWRVKWWQMTPSFPRSRSPRWGKATRAESDKQMLESWLASLSSAHSRRNFETTARRFLAELPAGGLRAATVEDTRDALGRISRDVSEATGRQYVLRVKSLLGYAHRLGYAPFNVGVTIKVRSDARNRGANLAKRIISEVDVAVLVRGARTKRDRVSELVALTWADVITREGRQVQLSILGKGGVFRQVLLPEAVSRSLLSLRGDAGANDPVFASRKRGGPLTTRAVLGTVKRAAARAGLEAPISPDWLRHARASHAIDRDATLPEVQATLGHGNHRHYVWLSARQTGELERAQTRPRGVSSMTTSFEI
jgi:integrase/recombinase XerD